MLMMMNKVRNIAHILFSSCCNIANNNWQTHLCATISPRDTGFLHFPFSKFRHCYLSSQSPVSPFPHGTCSLGVSNKDTALHELYHLFHALFPRCMTHRRYTVHWRLQTTQRIVTLIYALFQGRLTASQLVAHRLPTTHGKMIRFPDWACPDAFAIAKGVLMRFLSTAYLYA